MLRVKHLLKLPKTVWGLGLVSFLSNSSNVIISSLSPSLILDVLGGTAVDLGIIRGLTECLGFVVKLFAGVFSDYLGKRKILVTIGYVASALAKPIYATTTSLISYAIAQTVDRITNGLRDAPRDAMIAEVSPKSLKGSAFGLRQALAGLGSTVGAIAAFMLMLAVGGAEEHMIRSAYWFSIIPIMIAILILIIMTKDSPDVPKLSKRQGFPIKRSDLSQLGWNYWFFMFVVLVFMCARNSESFVVLRAKTVNLSAAYHPLILCMLYFTTSISANLIGIISDKINKKLCLGAGFLISIIAFITLGIASNTFMIFVATAIYGVHFGITQTVLFAMVADYSPKQIKATSFGILNLTCAIGVITASLSQGKIWDLYGPTKTYMVASIIAFIATILLIFIKPSEQLHDDSEDTAC